MSLFEIIYQSATFSSHKNKDTFTLCSNYYPTITPDAKNNLFYILNYGSIEAKYPYSLSANSLESYLLLYTISGEGQFIYNNQTYSLTKNSLVFINCLKGFHVKVAGSSTWSYQRLYLNGSHLPFLYSKYMKSSNPVHQYIPSSNLPDFFMKLINYIKLEDPDELVCSALIDTLLTNLVVEKNSCNLDTSIPKYIIQVRDLFDTEYFNNFDLNDLSIRFNVSKYTLSREFSKCFGISPIEYLIRNRIKIAKELLVNTNYTISEVSLRIGIFNTTHFINLFKKNTGITPLQYRKQLNKELNVFDSF